MSKMSDEQQEAAEVFRSSPSYSGSTEDMVPSWDRNVGPMPETSIGWQVAE